MGIEQVKAPGLQLEAARSRVRALEADLAAERNALYAWWQDLQGRANDVNAEEQTERQQVWRNLQRVSYRLEAVSEVLDLMWPEVISRADDKRP